MDQNKKRFNVRALTSLTVTVSFLCLAFTGIVLYFTPKGRVAHWTGWTMFGLEKEEWAGVHTTLAILFVIASAIHIYFNWRILIRYFTDAIAKGMRNRAELAAALIITLVFFVGTLKMWPPWGTVIDWGEDIKDYWERKSAPAPYAHAEESTLTEFAQNMGITSDELAEYLAAKGFEVSDLSVTVGDLARTHGVSPNEVFEALPKTIVPVLQTGHRGQGGYNRYGQKTLEQLCQENNIDLKKAVDTLARHGIEARAGDRLKLLAERGGTTPRRIGDMVMGGE